MIHELEKKILEKMDFTNKFLRIRKKYIDDGLDTPIFKKNEILRLFKELNEECRYINGGAYVIKKLAGEYAFECSFIISKNSVNIYYYIYHRGKLIEGRVTNIGSILRYLPYDATLLTDNYGLNSLEDLSNFIRDHVKLFNEFVKEYISEVKPGIS